MPLKEKDPFVHCTGEHFNTAPENNMDRERGKEGPGGGREGGDGKKRIDESFER